MITLMQIVSANNLETTRLWTELTHGAIGSLFVHAIEQINRDLALLNAPSEITAQNAIQFTVEYRELLQQKQVLNQILELRTQLPMDATLTETTLTET